MLQVSVSQRVEIRMFSKFVLECSTYNTVLAFAQMSKIACSFPGKRKGIKQPLSRENFEKKKNLSFREKLSKNQLCWCRLVYASAVVSKLEAHSIRVQINLCRYPFFKRLLEKAVWQSKKNIKTRGTFTKTLLVWWSFGKIVFISSVFKKCEPAERFFWGQRFHESSMRASVIRKAEKNGGNVQSRSELWR